jgi:hypothetical protein
MHTSLSALDSAGTLPSTLSAGEDGASVSIPDAHFLFHADFKRAGSDLILTGEDGHRVIVPGYFKHEHLPTLVAPNGGGITGDVVEALVGPQAPDQYAQAGTQVQTSPLAIGRVASLEGGATAFRNGVQVSLNVGDVVVKGDVIQTSGGSAVGVIFSDGTTFSLSADARMVLNDFVYNPGGSHNSALVNLVQGSLTFVAGEVAHTGDMRVGTPVAVMGIRGTVVSLTVHAVSGVLDASVLAEGDLLTHSIVVWAPPTPEDVAAGRLVGAQLGIVTNNDGVFSFIPTPTGILVQETGKDATTLQTELNLIQNVFLTKSVGEAILAQQPLPHSSLNGNPLGTQITTTFPTDVSLEKIVVDVTGAGLDFKVLDVHVILPPPIVPAGVPFTQQTFTQQAQGPVVAHEIGNQASPEDAPWTFQIPADTFTDANGDPLTLTATLANGDPLPSWLSFDSSTRTFSGTPPHDFNGSFDFKITASDGALTTSDAFTLTITPVNDPPVANQDIECLTRVIVFDPFNDAHFHGWAPVSLGNAAMHWVMNGHSAAERSDSGTGFLKAPAAFGAPTMAAYAIDVDVNPNTRGFGASHANNGVGVVFGYVDSGNYYLASWADYGTDYFNSDHRDLILSKFVNGVETVLDRVNHIDLGTGEIHFQVVVNANGTVVNVTGEDHSAQLTSSDAPEFNSAGLFTDNNDDGIAYDNFAVTNLGPLTTYEDTPLAIPAAVLLANDTDVDDPHSALTIIGVTDVANGHGHAVLNGGVITFIPDANYNGDASFSYTVSDGHPGGTATTTVNLNILGVDDPPVIHTPAGGIHYWASNTFGDVTPINHISFDDPDAGSYPVVVTFSMNDFGDQLNAENLCNSGVTVLSGDGTSHLKLQGSIADINAYLFGGNLLWNPDGHNDHELGLLSVQIENNNGFLPGGDKVVSASVLISEISTPDFSGSSVHDFSKVNFTNIGTVCAGGGCDEITTSFSHQGSPTTYDGGNGYDTIHLVFTADQLAEILADPGMQCELRSYVDDPCGQTLDLCGSSWNAKAENFERADVNIVTGLGSGIVSNLNGLTPDAGFFIGSNCSEELSGWATRSNVIVGLGGNDHLVGGNLADVLLGGAGNDILIGGLGNDVLSGGTGSNTFKFLEMSGTSANFGKDIIVDFQPGKDVIEIDHSLFANVAALQAAIADDGHGNAVVTADANNTITLAGLSVATATAHLADFHLV